MSFDPDTTDWLIFVILAAVIGGTLAIDLWRK